MSVTDTNDGFFEAPNDLTPGGQSALVNGSPAQINSITAALGVQLVVANVNGTIVNISIRPIRVVVESGFFDDAYVVFPGLPPGAVIISVSLPLLFPTDVGLPVCLTTDTLVLTDQGVVRAGDLGPGDLVQTRDDGLQPVRWIGRQAITFQDQPLNQKFLPIVLEPHALEPGVPETLLTVSPQHAILVRSPWAMLLFGQTEVLVAAKHLVNGTSIRVDADCADITYCHILLDMHALIIAEGAAVESLYLGDVALRSVGAEARAEIFALFPELRDTPVHMMDRARLLLKGYEARVLLDTMRGKTLANPARATARIPANPRRKIAAAS